MMKKHYKIQLILLALLFIVSNFSFGQENTKDWQLTNQAYEKEKKEMMAKFVQLPDGDVFWELYTEFEKQRGKYSNESYNVLLDYAENYVNYSDARLEQIMQDNMRVRSKMDELLESYYSKIKEECGVKTASQFWMIERYFESMLRANVLGNLPIVEK